MCYGTAELTELMNRSVIISNMFKLFYICVIYSLLGGNTLISTLQTETEVQISSNNIMNHNDKSLFCPLIWAAIWGEH